VPSQKPEAPDRIPKGYTPETVLTIEEVAEWLGVSVRTVERWPIKRLTLSRSTRRYLAKHVLEYLEAKAAA
jgi:excisionase family DNA binding protein